MRSVRRARSARSRALHTLVLGDLPQHGVQAVEDRLERREVCVVKPGCGLRERRLFAVRDSKD